MSEIPPIRLFYSYAREDEVFRQALDKHLSALKRTGVIAPWHDRRIVPGVDWAREIDKHLEHAHLILLLVSADFLASEYCWGVEMTRALEMHRAGSARVVPVMVRPVDIEGVPFANLQALPRDAKPITEWRNPDTAWADVAKGIRLAAKEVRDQGLARPDRMSLEKHLSSSSIPPRSIDQERPSADHAAGGEAPVRRKNEDGPIFRLKLQQSYYQKGFFNVVVKYDQYVRKADGPIRLRLGRQGKEIEGILNRQANANGTARIYGAPTLTRWFQANFEPMETVAVDLSAEDVIILDKE